MPLSTMPNAGIPMALRKKAEDAASGAVDMSPEDWRGLVSGLLKLFAEEAEEPEHAEDVATDSKLKLALDRASVRSFDVDGRLHIAETNVCKACISPYRGDEIPGHEELGLDPDRIYKMLRPPEELEKSVPTINGIPLLRDHVPVDADDHKPYDVAGALGTTGRWVDPYVKNGLTIWAAKDIEGIEKKEKCELSPGYHYLPLMEAGLFGGEPYDGKMTNIVFNHVAIVEEGRQGPDVIISDGIEDLQWAIIEREILRSAEEVA